MKILQHVLSVFILGWAGVSWTSTAWSNDVLKNQDLSHKTDLTSLDTAVVSSGPWQRIDKAFAQVSAIQQQSYHLPFSAQITSVDVAIGEQIEAGQVLLNFDSSDFRGKVAVWYRQYLNLQEAQHYLAGLERGEKNHSITRANLAAGKQFVADAQNLEVQSWGVIQTILAALHFGPSSDKIAFDGHMTRILLAQKIKLKGLLAASASLSYLQASFAGVVTQQSVSAVEHVETQSSLMKIERLSAVFVDVGLREKDISTWSSGKSYWKNGDHPIELTLMEGLPRYDARSGLWLLRFKVNNSEQLLWSQQWLEIEHQSAVQTVMWVPSSAVVSRGNKFWCIEVRDNKVVAVPVSVGAADHTDRTPILKGLNLNSQVVVKGAYEWLYRDLKNLVKFVD